MSVESIVSVNSFKQAGFKIFVNHYRRYRRYEGGKIHIDLISNVAADPAYCLPKGGATYVKLVCPNGNEFSGLAKCCNTDSYNKRIGVSLALNDCIRKILVSKVGQ